MRNHNSRANVKRLAALAAIAERYPGKRQGRVDWKRAFSENPRWLRPLKGNGQHMGGMAAISAAYRQAKTLGIKPEPALLENIKRLGRPRGRNGKAHLLQATTPEAESLDETCLLQGPGISLRFSTAHLPSILHVIAVDLEDGRK